MMGSWSLHSCSSCRFQISPIDKSARSDDFFTTLVDGDLQLDPNWPERSSAFHRRCKVWVAFFLDRFISAFCQLVLASWKPHVVQYEPFTCTHLIFPSVYQMLVGLIGSFGSFVYNMSEYHILSDNVPIAPKVFLKFWLRIDLQMLHNVTFLLGYRSSTEADGILFHSFSVQVGTTLI